MKNRRALHLVLFFLALVALTAAAFFLEDRSSAPAKEKEFLTAQKVGEPTAFIRFSDSGIEVEGNGTAMDRKTVLILSGGTYELSGKCSDARVLVMCRKQKVTLILNGLDLSYGAGSPLFIYKCPLTVVELAEGTENRLSDPISYDYSDSYSAGSRNEPCSVIYSRKDLVIQGKGSLVLEGNYRDGIRCLDSVGIFGCSLTVSAPGRGVSAGDTLCGEDCRLKISSGEEAVLTDDDPDGVRTRFVDCELDIGG